MNEPESSSSGPPERIPETGPDAPRAGALRRRAPAVARDLRVPRVRTDRPLGAVRRRGAPGRDPARRAGGVGRQPAAVADRRASSSRSDSSPRPASGSSDFENADGVLFLLNALLVGAAPVVIAHLAGAAPGRRRPHRHGRALHLRAARDALGVRLRRDRRVRLRAVLRPDRPTRTSRTTCTSASSPSRPSGTATSPRPAAWGARSRSSRR